MNKIFLIIQREYLTRVKKKSFIIMSFVGPLLMAAMFVVPVWLTTMSDDEDLHIAVIDPSGETYKSLENTDNLEFEYLANENLDNLKANFFTKNYDAILALPKKSQLEEQEMEVFSENQLNLGVLSYIRNSIEKQVENEKFKAKGIDKQLLDSLKTKLEINTIILNEEGGESESSTEASMAIGLIFSLIIYMFIFMYGAQVMRGVLEEKTGRIVEIIISSVKPFELMMGKVVGIALVALTQFALWVILTFAIVSIANIAIFSVSDSPNVTEMTQMAGGANEQVTEALQNSNSEIAEIMQKLYNLPYGMILFTFVFYFIGGYLLYASLFAAIGGAVDNETDTQQFMLPITVPLILAIMLAQVIIQNPNGSVAFWFSMIPFTSPVIMIIRVGFGVEWWEILLSMFLLIITFIGTTWIAAKIYRTGILLYGKKISYKELWKWLKY